MSVFFRMCLLLSFAILTSCAHSIHEVHTSDFTPMAPLTAGKVVVGKAEQFSVMGFVYDTQYLDAAYTDLLSACPDGRISGITTQLSTSLGLFSWTHKVLMQGLCLPSRS